MRVKIRTRLGRLQSTIQVCWVVLQDLHQLSVVQGGHTGRGRARRMENLMRASLPTHTYVSSSIHTIFNHSCTMKAVPGHNYPHTKIESCTSICLAGLAIACPDM